MLIGEKIAFLELQKTGSTHTRKILQSIPSFQCSEINQHYSYRDLSKQQQAEFDTKIKIGNIRNPWDWYVSLWAFGCMQKGGLYGRLTLPLKKSVSLIDKIMPKSAYNKAKWWEELYSDVNNTDNFKKWLNLILNSDINIKESYKNTPVSKNIGLLTFRYLRLFTKNDEREIAELNSREEVENYDTKENFITHFLPLEALDKELRVNAEIFGVTKDEMSEAILVRKSPSNKSVRNSDFSIYYDDDDRQLVAEKEFLIISKHNYSFESAKNNG